MNQGVYEHDVFDMPDMVKVNGNWDGSWNSWSPSRGKAPHLLVNLVLWNADRLPLVPPKKDTTHPPKQHRYIVDVKCFSHLFPETWAFVGLKEMIRLGWGVSTLWSLWLSEHHLLKKPAWSKPIRLFDQGLWWTFCWQTLQPFKLRHSMCLGTLGPWDLGPKGWKAGDLMGVAGGGCVIVGVGEKG